MTKSKKFMPKSKKTIKKSKRPKSNRSKRIKTRRKNDYINIDNTGSTKIVYTEGKQSPKKTVFEWNGNYDGKNAKIHMDLNVDGKKTKTDVSLTNKDLLNILGSTNVVQKPIDQRLQLLDEDLSSMYPSSPIIIHSGEMPMPREMHMTIEEMPMSPSMSSEIHMLEDIPLKSKGKRSTKK